MLTHHHRRAAIIFDAVIAGFFAVLASIFIDYQYYSKIVFVPLRFAEFNIGQGISSFYGTHPFHFYFTQGLPLVLLTFAPLCAYGAYKCDPEKRSLLYMCLFVVTFLSTLAHKEFRFLMPIVSPLLIYAGVGLLHIQRYDMLHRRNFQSSLTKKVIMILLVSNMGLGFYLGTIHKRGVVQVTEWIRTRAGAGLVTSVLFLMPCHSTPFYSHTYHDIPMRFITCLPPLDIP